LWAWEMLLPVIGPLPQISHRCAMSRSSRPPQWGGDFYTRRSELQELDRESDRNRLIFIT